MNKFKINILVICTIIFISGCSVSVPEIKYNAELKSTNFEGIVSSLLKKASNQIFPNMSRNEVLLVTNFAETYTLKSNTKLSFILTDHLKSNLVSRYSYTVREIELSENFRFGKEGFKALTRDRRNLKEVSNQSRYVVVTNYTLSKNQLILFLKLINMDNGSILAASTHSVNLTQEIKELNTLPKKTDNIQEIYAPMVL